MQNTKTSDKSPFAKIEEYTGQQFDSVASYHLKSQITSEIKNDRDSNNANTKKWNPNSWEQRLQPY